MGEEKDPSAAQPVDVAPASVAPRPVSVVPRPSGSAPLSSRMPPPPSARGLIVQGAPGAFRSAPPPPPQRQPVSSVPAGTVPPASSASVAASPSVVPRAPATPPPPPQRHSAPPSYSPPPARTPAPGVAAQLEQRLGAAQLELRKLGSERHTLRARLRREADRVHELESALHAEKELRRHASEEHQVALAGLRARLSDLEAQSAAELARLRQELAARVPAPAAAPAREPKVVSGLRRIRGIGPAYERALEGLGVTRVEQVAAWTAAETQIMASKLKIRLERILKDDWVGQAKALERAAEADGWD